MAKRVGRIGIRFERRFEESYRGSRVAALELDNAEEMQRVEISGPFLEHSGRKLLGLFETPLAKTGDRLLEHRRGIVHLGLLEVIGAASLSIASASLISRSVPARVVGRKRNIDLVVDVEPFGVVVELFCHEGGPRHEAKRLTEILELEPLRDRV